MMDPAMAQSAHPGVPPALRRDTGRRVLAGVCAGIGARFGVDPLLVRVGFVLGAMAGGVGLVVYALLWLVVPAERVAGGTPLLRVRTERASVQVALGVGLLLLSALLTSRALGLWFSDALVWPLVLMATGGALIWRQSLGGAPDPASALTASAATAPARGGASRAAPAAVHYARRRLSSASRTSLGVVLVIGAGLAFLQSVGALSLARDVVLAALVVAAVLAVILAPWILRMTRSLSTERAERIRSQERAEMAAHVHDSVLQTLALMQKRADDPREVASLARRQEHELRSWLSHHTAPAGERRLHGAVREAAEEIEREHRVRVEVVAVGDAELDQRTEALVAATREAMLNAAKFGGGTPIDVYLEASDGNVRAFVRDRGPGFDPAALPPDRRGVSESIVGRMERNGGRAKITSSADEGTEVELVLEESGR
jgi:signal transduction histidine kinase